MGWVKGRPRSEETKLKISLSTKGRIGKKHSEETRKKIGDLQRGKKRGSPSQETRDKIGKAHLGMRHTEESKKRISEGHMGQVAWNAGKPWSEESRKKMSDARNGRFSGENSPTWKGGVSKTNEYRTMYKRRYKLRKKSIEGCHSIEEWNTLKESNGCRCNNCNRQEPEVKLTVDHIVPISRGGTDYIDNIQPLCRSCNSKKHNKISNTELLRKD